MDNGNYVMTDKYKRIQGAKLKIQNKNYFIYKGVNTIGRNKTAIINLKNLSISQQHALIIIVDDTQHFISDLNSSNGTYLFGSKLFPFKLYELPNDVEIKFGDVATTYFKVSNLDTTVNLEMENIDMTQNMTQTFYGATTQIINESALNETKLNEIPHGSKDNIEDIHEAVTQVVIYPPTFNRKEHPSVDTNYSAEILDNDIHEAPTQVVNYETPVQHVNDQASTSVAVLLDRNTQSDLLHDYKKKEEQTMDIHEMPTQVTVFEKLNNQCKIDGENNDSLTEINENVYKSSENSTRLDKESNFNNEPCSRVEDNLHISDVIEETVIEETVMEESCLEKDTNENSNDSIDFLTTHKRCEDEEVCREENLISDKCSNISDSEDIVLPRKRPVRKLSSSEDLTPSQIRKPGLNSDSDTDIEEEVNLQNKKNNPILHTNKEMIDSGSDTEIEEALPPKKKSKIINSDSETDIKGGNIVQSDILTPSQDIIKPKILSKKRVLDSDSETDIEDNIEKEFKSKVAQDKNCTTSEILRDTECKSDTLTQSQDIIKPQILSKKRVLDSDSETDIEDNIEKEFKSKVTQDENCTTSKILHDTDCKSDTLTQSQDIIKPQILSKKYVLDSDSETDIEDNIEKEFKSKVTQDKNCTTNEILNETDCIPATQDAFVDIFMYKNQQTSKSNINSENLSSEESFKLGLTELMVESVEHKIDENKENEIDNVGKDNRNSTNVTATSELISDTSIEQKDSNLNEDKKLAENKTVENSHVNQIQKNYTDDFKGQHSEQNTYEKDPVIAKENANVVKAISIDDAEDDIYIMPTQKLTEEIEIVEKNTSNDLKEPNLDKETDEDVYMMPTQTISASENEPQFKTPPQKKFTFKKKGTKLDISLSKVFSNKQDDHYSAAIQVNEHDDDIYMQPTQVLNVNQNKPDLYGQPTQDLNLQQMSTSEVNKDEDIYMASTQQINTEKEKNFQTNSEFGLPLHKIQDVNFADATVVKTTEDENEFYMAATQPIKLNLISKVDKSTNNKSVTDLYLQETQDIKLNENSKVNEGTINENHNITPAIKINQNVDVTDQQEHTNTNNLNADLKKNVNNVVAETLSQIDAFIKQPLSPKNPVKDLIQTKKKCEETYNKSETLSQIERFVREPLIKKEISKIKTLPKRSRKSSHTPVEETVSITEPVETLSQIEAFVKQPLKNEENVKFSHDLNKLKEKTEGVLEAGSNRERRSRVVYSKGKSEEKQSSNKSEEKPCTSSEESSTSIKNDFEKSFALLEAKSTKTRKSQRLTNATEIKVALCKNRRSMTTSVIPESSSNTNEIKSTTRRTRKKTNNNNNLVSEKMDSEVTMRSKRKLETTSINDTDASESEKPNKIKKVTANETKTDLILKVSSSAQIKDTETFETIKPNTKIKVSKKGKLAAKIDIPTELCSPSTSKAKTSTTICKSDTNSVIDFHLDSDNISNKSSSSTLSTPSRRGARNTMNKTSTTICKSDTNSEIDFHLDNDNISNKSSSSTLSTPSRRGARNTMNKTIGLSPDKSKRKQKPKIVFTMLDSPLLESLIRHLGGSVVDNVESSTVLITEQVKRSQKLLSAVGQGKPICSPKWIHASKKANEFLDPWDFILVDKEAETKWNFSLKESITRAKNGKLLGSYTFLLMVNNAADVLKGAIEACGGKCVPRHPAKHAEGFFVIVASPENKSKYLKVKKQHPQVTVVEPEAIFDGVLRQDLRLGRHLLT